MGTAMQKIRAATAMLIALLVARTAWAASPIPQRSVDLGATSFLDGEASPGFLLEINRQCQLCSFSYGWRRAEGREESWLN
jgi:hypothetical protein